MALNQMRAKPGNVPEATVGVVAAHVPPLAGPHTQAGPEVAVCGRVKGERVLPSLSSLPGKLRGKIF